MDDDVLELGELFGIDLHVLLILYNDLNNFVSVKTLTNHVGNYFFENAVNE